MVEVLSAMKIVKLYLDTKANPSEYLNTKIQDIIDRLIVEIQAGIPYEYREHMKEFLLIHA